MTLLTTPNTSVPTTPLKKIKMDKTLQDLAWRCLPSEVRKGIKWWYKSEYVSDRGYQPTRTMECLTSLFGHNNLTSDAEGEEMLYVKAKTVREMYAANDRLIAEFIGSEIAKDAAIIINNMLRRLYSSKCLPDENYSNVEKLEKNDEPKPAEPKFKVGDKVKAHYPYGDEIGHIQEVMLDGTYDIDFGGGCTGHGITEDMLEPYTEQKEEKSEHLHAESVENLQIADEESHLRNLSQETANCDKEFDTILKDGFRNERRLNIAAMAMQGLLANSHQELVDMKIKQVAQLSLEMTDALIAEAEKGNSDGED